MRAIRRIGDYELLEEIARGGMGVVFRARQVSLDRIVAVKLMRDSALARAEDVRRFHAEAAAAARLKHPNIVSIHEVGEQDGQHYFAMDLIEGMNLAERTREGPLLTREAAQLVATIADAVQHAHEQGVLHRDLKPSNVLVDTAGKPFVTDFGLARPLDANSTLTMTGQVLGTPGYMPPEQATGKGMVGPAADIYSLGALLYHFLTGRAPFVGGTTAETLRHVVEQEPVSPQLLNPEVPRDVATVCLKCLEKDPVSRYGSAKALAEDLERWLRHEPIRARPVTFIERLHKWTRRNPFVAASLAAVAVIATLGLAGILWQWREAFVARRELRAELWQSHFSRAKAERQTLSLGRRVRSLEAIRAASALRPTKELRDEAAASLALADLRETGIRCPHPLASGFPEWAMDPQLAHFAVTAPDAVELWSVAGRSKAARLSHQERNTRFLRFSPDGRSLAVKYFNRDFVVWDVATRKPRFVAPLLKNQGEEDSLFGFDFSADCRVAGCSDRGKLFHLYEAATGKELRVLQVTNSARPIQMARFNPRLDAVALAAGNIIEVWTLTGERLAIRTNLLNAARIAWHPDGTTLAYVNWYEPEIVLWNIRSGKERILRSGQGSQFYLAFAPRGDLLAARGLDGVTRLWDLATEQVILNTESAASFEFSADGTQLGFDHQGEGVGLWEVVRSPVLQNLRKADASPNVALQTFFSDDGRRLIWRAADGVYGFDVLSGVIDRGPLGWTYSMCRDDSADALWGVTPEGIVQWKNLWQSTPRQQQLLRAGESWRWVGFAPQRRLLGFASETNIAVASLPDLNTIFSAKIGPSKAWAISPDGLWLAVAVGMHQDAPDDEVVVYDIQRERQAVRLKINAAALTFDPASRWLVTGSVDGCHFLDAGTWREARRFTRQSSHGRVMPMAFTRDGRWFAYARTPFVIDLAEAESGRVLVSLEAPTRLQLRGLAISPAGDLLAAAVENGVVQVWNLAALRRELAGLGLDWPDEQSSGTPRQP